jgi:predicted nucleotidyltransferase
MRQGRGSRKADRTERADWDKDVMATVHTMDASTRAKLLEQLATSVAQKPAVVFAYVYGSFVESEAFHDVDVGVYLESDDAEKATAVAWDLAQRLTARLGLPVDVRVLNGAPVTFRFHVFKGTLLFHRDEDRLTEVLEDTARRYLDVTPLLRQSAKEAFAA